jgi:hypothetical protein
VSFAFEESDTIPLGYRSAIAEILLSIDQVDGSFKGKEFI